MAGLIGDLLPLFIIFLIVGVGGFIGYHVYIVANEIGDKSRQKMEKKNIAFTKDGMKVGVKEIRNEEYADKTQSVLVKAWNSASIPAYKSRLGWNNSSTTTSSSPSTRPEVRRSKSSQPSVPRPSAGSRTSSSGSHKGAGSNGLAHSHSSGGLHAPRPAPVRQSSNPGAWPS